MDRCASKGDQQPAMITVVQRGGEKNNLQISYILTLKFCLTTLPVSITQELIIGTVCLWKTTTKLSY